jgi:hypothetical protein
MSSKRRILTIVGSITALTCSAPVAAQRTEQPPTLTPFPPAEFHFSDPFRDAQYWRLYRDMEQKLAAFRDAGDAAVRALSPPRAAPGTPAWVRNREVVEQAILARRPAREALDALIDFVTRARPQLSPTEAEAAFDIIRTNDATVTATSDFLVTQLAYLAGIKMDRWPP